MGGFSCALLSNDDPCGLNTFGIFLSPKNGSRTHPGNVDDFDDVHRCRVVDVVGATYGITLAQGEEEPVTFLEDYLVEGAFSSSERALSRIVGVNDIN